MVSCSMSLSSFPSGKTNIYLDTQHPQGRAGLEKVQEVEDAFLSKYQRQVSGPEAAYPKPVFTTPLKPQFSLGEAEPLNLECNVEPKEDPNLKVEWYFNGKALEHGKLFVEKTTVQLHQSGIWWPSTPDTVTHKLATPRAGLAHITDSRAT